MFVGWFRFVLNALVFEFRVCLFGLWKFVFCLFSLGVNSVDIVWFGLLDLLCCVFVY